MTEGEWSNVKMSSQPWIRIYVKSETHYCYKLCFTFMYMTSCWSQIQLLNGHLFLTQLVFAAGMRQWNEEK